jgi:hypothetical protein
MRVKDLERKKRWRKRKIEMERKKRRDVNVGKWRKRDLE